MACEDSPEDGDDEMDEEEEVDTDVQMALLTSDSFRSKLPNHKRKNIIYSCQNSLKFEAPHTVKKLFFGWF